MEGSKLSIVVLIITIVSGAFFYNKFIKPDTYRAFFYPYGDTDKSLTSEVDDEDACWDWIDRKLDKYEYSTSHDYECGKNCEKDEFGLIYICEETL